MIYFAVTMNKPFQINLQHFENFGAEKHLEPHLLLATNSNGREMILPFMSLVKIQEKAPLTPGKVARFVTSESFDKKSHQGEFDKFNLKVTKSTRPTISDEHL